MPVRRKRGQGFWESLKHVDAFGHEVNLHIRGHGHTYDTMCGGITTILVYILFLVFVVTRLMLLGKALIPSLFQEDAEPLLTYGFFENFLPEIAGVAVCGRWIVEKFVTPINRINYNLELISSLFQAKSKRVNESPIPKDTIFCPSCACTCCCGVESESSDEQAEKQNRSKKYETSTRKPSATAQSSTLPVPSDRKPVESQ